MLELSLGGAVMVAGRNVKLYAQMDLARIGEGRIHGPIYNHILQQSYFIYARVSI